MVLAAAVAVGLTLAGCGDDGEEDAAPAPAVPVEFTGSSDAFYVPPDPLPDGEHGDLVRYQRIPEVLGGNAYRVMYLSESVQGERIVVTGQAALPSGGGSDRLVMTWAHGTTGIADQCAPSRNPDPSLDAFAGLFLDRGWAIAATDYEGLGTPGRHPYIAGVSEGRSTLDIVRAVGQLPAAATGPRTIIWGHSQGGHAALFAAELAPSWTPELEVVGTVAGAPPSDLPDLASSLRGWAYQGYVALAAAGLNAAYPEAELADVLTPEALDLLDVVDDGCTDAVFDVFNDVPYDEIVKTEPADVPAWRKIFEANDPGRAASPSPLLIIHGEADEQIPVERSEALFRRLCALGQVVERRTYAGQSHAGVVLRSFPEMLQWMDDRAAGKPASSGC